MATTITTKGILTINGKQVEETFNGLKRASGQLERELKKLTPGTQEFIDKSAQLKDVNKRFDEVRSQIKNTKEEAKTLNGAFGDMKGKLTDTFASILSGEVSFKSFGSTIKVFAAQSWAAIGSIPIIGWVAAIAAGIGLAVREIIQYNTELQEANKLTASVTKLQGEALDEISLKSRAMESAFGFDRKETLEAAKALVNEFKISYIDALDQIEKGAVKGGKTNTEYLDSIREYPAFFAKAGFAVQDFIAIVNAGYDLGIYNDKLPDAIKEFNISITEQTKSSRDALVNAFGAPFADELLQKVNTGKVTVKDALSEIAAESGKYNLTQKQQAQLTADLFRGAGEDAGGFLAIMQAVIQAAEDLNRPLTETEQILQDQVDKYNELETAKYEAMESDSVIALKREFDILWKNLQIGYYNFIAWIRSADREFKASGVYMGALFASLPSAAAKSFRGIMDSLSVLVSGMQAGGKAIGSFLTGDFDQAEREFERFKSKYYQFETDINKSVNNFGKDVTKSALNAANAFRGTFDAATAAKAEAERLANAVKPGNNNDGSEAKGAADKKAADKAAKEAEAARKKAAAELKKYQEQIEKDEEESLKKLLSLQDEYLKNKADLIQDEFERETAKETARRDIESRKILTEIAELEIKKIQTKSAIAKQKYQESIDILNQIEIQNEQTHFFKLREIWQKNAAKKFDDFSKNEQAIINEQRRIDEDLINNISTMEDAEIALSNMKYLKLTQTELSGIKTLEDAKRALREDADRKMLAAQLESLKKMQGVVASQITAAIQVMDFASVEELSKNLQIIEEQMTRITGLVNGGTEQDNAKKVAENRAKRGAVDLLGFSVQDWEDMYNNLDTTEGKIQGVIMAMQALSNAVKMYAQMQAQANERDLKKFEQIQDKKKQALLKQLNEGYITNEQYNQQIILLEKEKANKQAEINYKQAKAEKAANIMSAIAGTASAVVGALGNKPWTPLNFVLAGLVGALGAVQIGMIAAQPLPERPSFARGGFTGSGFGDPDNTGFRPAGIVHQNEWVAPEWMTENPRTAKVIDYLESIRLGKSTPMAEGGFVQDTAQTSASASPVTAENAGNSELMPVLYRLGNFLEYLITKGVYIEKNPKNGKEAKEMIEMWDELKNKNKH